MVGVLPATKCPKGQVKECFSSTYMMLGLWISPAGTEKGRPLLATVKTLKRGTAGTQGTEKCMSTLCIKLFGFLGGKEIPFLLCNQETEDVYLQITNCLWCDFSWKRGMRMFSCRLFSFLRHFALTFFALCSK